jgi:hypothetical protein
MTLSLVKLCILFVNQSPVISSFKKQKTVENSTYGPEFMVACQAEKQIINLCNTLCTMGIPLNCPSWMFGDNASVITSSTIPQSTLNMRQNSRFYHYFHKCIASKIFNLLHCSGKLNVTGMLTKPLGWVSFWPLEQPLYFWKGETVLYKPFSLFI